MKRLAYRRIFFVALLSGMLGGGPLARGRRLRLEVSQKIGYEQEIAVEGGRKDDGYSETSLVIEPSHPVVFWNGRLSLSPRARLSYLDYFTLDRLDAFTFTLDGPLRLDFLEAGDRPRYLTLRAGAHRRVEAVSTRTDRRAIKTDLTFGALYSQYLPTRSGRSNWATTTGAPSTTKASTVHWSATGIRCRWRRFTPSAARWKSGFAGATPSMFSGSLRRPTARRRRCRGWSAGRSPAGCRRKAKSATKRFASGATRKTSGVTLRGGLSWQPTHRWDVAARVRQRLEVAAEAAGECVQVFEGNLRAAYNFNSKFSGSLAPAIKHERRDGRTTEYGADLGLAYAFRHFDLAWQIGVRDRQAQAGGGGDSYTAMHTWVEGGEDVVR